MILFKGGASEPYDMRLPDKAGGAVAVRRTLASTICRIADPTQVPRPRQLRDASTVMRFRPAHQSVINRRHDDRVSCLARHSLKQTLERKPRTRLPATWNGGHESGLYLILGTLLPRHIDQRLDQLSLRIGQLIQNHEMVGPINGQEMAGQAALGPGLSILD